MNINFKNNSLLKNISEYNKIVNEVKAFHKVEPMLEDKFILEHMVKKSPSTLKRIKQIRNSLLDKWLDEKSINSFIVDNLEIIISAWAKWNAKGKILNDLVLNKIKSIVGNNAEVKSEVFVKSIKTEELVDFAIKFKNGREIVGFNQISLWGWWQQINRFGKYLNVIKRNPNVFLVVYDIPTLKNSDSKSKLINYIVDARKTWQLIWLEEIEKKIKILLESN